MGCILEGDYDSASILYQRHTTEFIEELLAGARKTTVPASYLRERTVTTDLEHSLFEALMTFDKQTLSIRLETDPKSGMHFLHKYYNAIFAYIDMSLAELDRSLISIEPKL